MSLFQGMVMQLFFTYYVAVIHS